ncbi:MAG: hypothetical protein KF739_04645 [Cryobacterium sp.]|nr:hypothetical protein [Cryobacterium sp.]
MNELLTLREEIVDALDGLDLNLYTHVPGRPALPCAWVQAGSPYITAGQTVDERIVRFNVILAAQVGDNLTETTALDELIESGMAALENNGWVVEEVFQPFSAEFNGTTGLITSITVATPATFS